MVRLVNQVQHDRARAEVEGYEITDLIAGVAVDGQHEPPLLDCRHSDDRAGCCALHDGRVA